MDNPQNFRQEVMQKSAPVFYSLSGNSSKARGQLATLRKAGLGKLSETPDVWEVVYRKEPFTEYPQSEEALSEALFSALHLFAVHARRNSEANKSSSEGGLGIGEALAKLNAERGNIDAKASAVFAATSPQQIVRLLSPLLRMLPNVSIDYPKLVWEIYLLSTSHRKSVQKNWAMSYYRKTFTPKTK